MPRDANVQLIISNARLGAQIALAVCNLKSKKT
jgi:pseudouridine-5'-phosphate glycosidase